MTEEEKAAEDALFFGTGFVIDGKHYPVEDVTIKIDYKEGPPLVKTAAHFEFQGNVYAAGKRQYKRSFRKLWQVTHGFSNSRKADGWRRHVRRMKGKRCAR